MFKHIFALLACLLVSLETSASPSASFAIDTPIQSIEGTIIDVEALRTRVRTIDQHRNDADLSNILKFELVSDQILPELLLSCGNQNEFSDFFKRHGFGTFQLTSNEEALLKECLTGVFEYADSELGFAAPGLYKRFSTDYLDTALRLGYRCGYRSQRLFSRFALSVWLIHPYEIAEFSKFRCLGDITTEYGYSEASIEWGVARIADEVLYSLFVFGTWNDAKRYQEYANLVGRNRELEMCRELINEPFDDPELQEQLVLETGCLETLAAEGE